MSLEKTADRSAPHAVFRGPGGWEWRVLKTYRAPAGEQRDRYARWLCYVTSPYAAEYGDTYVADIRRGAVLVACSAEWAAAYGEGAELPLPADAQGGLT